MMEMLQRAAGIELVRVPYKGLAPAMTDLLAGHVDIMIDALAHPLPHITDGKLKALGVASEAPLPELPDVAPFAKTLPGFVFTEWYAVMAPPNTPPDLAATISLAINDAIRMPEVAQKIGNMGVRPLGTSPAETAAFLKQEAERWRNVIATTGIKLERGPGNDGSDWNRKASLTIARASGALRKSRVEGEFPARSPPGSPAAGRASSA